MGKTVDRGTTSEADRLRTAISRTADILGLWADMADSGMGRPSPERLRSEAARIRREMAGAASD